MFLLQGPEHPNPGKPFTARGFPRQCYLPDNAQGRKVKPRATLGKGPPLAGLAFQCKVTPSQEPAVGWEHQVHTSLERGEEPLSLSSLMGQPVPLHRYPRQDLPCPWETEQLVRQL